ncbi:hypothetical protein [Nocardia spumae]|uniref:hypothetical protein n=1 Tax=Nocardia spumae TaxID=2887190 RepID=UPI001D139E29|nr:hypothetical protein [Nocardia spumae]
MATRTPWTDVHPRTEGTEPPRGALPAPPGDRRPLWGYLTCAALSAATLILLFQPWLSASGRAGTIRSDAFGRVDGVTGTQESWDGSGVRSVDISGTWAVLTCVAVLAAIFAAGAYLRTRAAVFAHATAVAGAAVAIFVLANVLYLNDKEADLRAAVDYDSGLSGLFRNLFGGAHSAHQLAGAHLDIAALLAGITAFGAAVSALAHHLPTAAAARPVAQTPPPPVAQLVETAPPPMPAAAPQPMSAAAPQPMPAAPAQMPAPAPVIPPIPVVPVPAPELHEPAPEPPPFPAPKQPSWRIVIPAGEISAHTYSQRPERTLAG